MRPIVAGAGAVCALLGLLAVISWHMHWCGLLQLRPDMPPMQYNTAICFILAGLALAAWGRMPRAMIVLGGMVASFGGSTLGEYLLHMDLGIDQLLFHTYITTQVSNPGRMSPVSAFCFALMGLALLLLGLRVAPRWGPLAVGSLASVIISIALVALAGYLFGLPGTYGWGQLTRVAIHTSAGLALAGAGLFIIAWAGALRPGEQTPRWLPAPLALGVLTGSLVLYFALETKQDQEIAQTVKAGAESVQNQIATRMEARFHSLARMGKDWEFSGRPSQAAWEASAASYVHDLPDMQALEWIDAAHRLRWVVPLAGNESKLNLDLTTEPRRKAAVDLARQEHRPVMTRIVTLFHGGLGFIVYVPLVVHGQSDGFIAAVFNAQSCLDRYLPPAVASGEAVQVFERSQLFYERDAAAPPVRDEWVDREVINLDGATWNLRMWPTPALAARLDSRLPGVVLCAGALGALLLGAVCFFAQRSSRQAIETTRANTALQAALGRVQTLEGLLPICSTCKRVRDDTGYWNQIDTYLHQHTRASLSHSYCPECAAKTFKDFGLEVPESVQADIAAGKFEKTHA